MTHLKYSSLCTEGVSKQYFYSSDGWILNKCRKSTDDSQKCQNNYPISDMIIFNFIFDLFINKFKWFINKFKWFYYDQNKFINKFKWFYYDQNLTLLDHILWNQWTIFFIY